MHTLGGSLLPVKTLRWPNQQCLHIDWEPVIWRSPLTSILLLSLMHGHLESLCRLDMSGTAEIIPTCLYRSKESLLCEAQGVQCVENSSWRFLQVEEGICSAFTQNLSHGWFESWQQDSKFLNRESLYKPRSTSTLFVLLLYLGLWDWTGKICAANAEYLVFQFKGLLKLSGLYRLTQPNIGS